jgi:hypothetical protein
MVETSFVVIVLVCVAVVALFFANRRASSDDVSASTRGFAIMIDAGSSGTRLHVFRHWRNSTTGHIVVVPVHHDSPTLKSALKVSPGLSDLAAHSDAQIETYLDKLITFAVQQVPAASQDATPVYLKGTAGLRLLPHDQRVRVLDTVRSVFVRKTPFDVRSFVVVAGDDEGSFLWKTVDTLQRRAGINAPQVGSIDVGGGSMQIAFPLAKELYVHSFLKYGVNEARYRSYAALLRDAGDAATQISDPCLPKGAELPLALALSTRATDDGRTEVVEASEAAAAHGARTLVGTGAFDECIALAKRLLERDVACAEPPCSMAGVHQPPLPLNTLFFVRDHAVRVVVHFLKLSRTPSLPEIEAAARAVCAQTDTEYSNSRLGAHKFYCFEAAWILATLRDGFGFPPTSRQVRFEDEIGGISTSWALGAVAHELETTDYAQEHDDL